MNYIELINQFWQVRRGKRITSTQADLYFCLLQESNTRNWENPFTFSNVQICANIGVSEPTLIDARARLKQLGLIDFEPGERKSTSPRYKILYLNNFSITFSKNRAKTNGENNSTLPPSALRAIGNENPLTLFSTDKVKAPKDGKSRNLTALLQKIENLNCSANEKQRMILLSNYGEIGNPIWKLFYEIDKGGIKMPEKFILSRLDQREKIGV
jgi:hypothetical protein